MDITTFIENFRKSFGERAELPIVFWYSDIPVNRIGKINGCFFKGMKDVRSGNPISLSEDAIGCGGGKFYSGFIDMPERIPAFVSLKEKYKETPALVTDFIEKLGVPRATKKYLNLARIDKVDCFDNLEGLFFFATPDILSGLTTWAFFDTNAEDAVLSAFGSGCSAIITQVVLENRKNGKRTFLGLLDPSVREHLEPDVLSYAIPMSRFKEMYYTMPACSLFDTHGWNKIKGRINTVS